MEIICVRFLQCYLSVQGCSSDLFLVSCGSDICSRPAPKVCAESRQEMGEVVAAPPFTLSARKDQVDMSQTVCDSRIYCVHFFYNSFLVKMNIDKQTQWRISIKLCRNSSNVAEGIWKGWLKVKNYVKVGLALLGKPWKLQVYIVRPGSLSTLCEDCVHSLVLSDHQTVRMIAQALDWVKASIHSMLTEN